MSTLPKKNLQSATNYYILPVFLRGLGGDLAFALTQNNQTCPLDVVQEQQEVKSVPENREVGLVVSNGGVEGKAGRETVNIWDVGVEIVSGRRRLGLSDGSFEVMLRRA
ncbi:hypothetical protein LguiB_020644 [Lonicera macranthoides]